MTTSTLRRRRVLLVDDEPMLLAGLKRAMRHEPFELCTAQSGPDALAVLQELPVDAVVSDQDMPGMSGVALFSVVSRLYPATVRFMLTGKATLDLAIEAINHGSIQRFFTKPMDPGTLAAQLVEALAQKALLEDAWRLVNRTREQNALILRLEQEQPGLTLTRHGTNGPLVLEEPPETLEELLEEINRVLGETPVATTRPSTEGE
jgi:response regulator RpfG family c-di-GMP phosphodiesterase